MISPVHVQGEGRNLPLWLVTSLLPHKVGKCGIESGETTLSCAADMHLVGASGVADIAETLLECPLRQRYGSWQSAPRSSGTAISVRRGGAV